ncbi:universal stress protein [Catelliglobosispora koreensis]|uniref:universal stress protein n=1 Tax=Catelliglobosispora koreensis TaxID=129052 RepID=UPI0003827176|nr:universal stress protein [Catelliglobosispora koreensis]
MDGLKLAGPIVAGYDGSPGADQALAWAMREAALRDAQLQVVHAIEWPVYVAPGDIGWLSGQERLDIAAKLASDAKAATGYTGEVSILDGSATGALCRLSKSAGMVVTGSRGMGYFSGMLIGSTSASVAVHAECTAIVVRGGKSTPDGPLPVVVGVDESVYSQRAAEFGFAEASARGCDVVAVRAWRPGPDPLGEIDTAERHALRIALDPARKEYPEVKFSLRLVADRPSAALVEASSEAQLVALGARGTGGFKGMLLGSVGHSLLHHAHCPVAVVR